jgi:hypothetical protein
MQKHPNDSEVQMWTCAAIQVVALQSIENKQKFGDEGACALILTAIQLHTSFVTEINAEVLIWGCQALTALLVDSTSNRCILRSTDTELVICTATKVHKANQELLNTADQVLFNMKPQIPQRPSGDVGKVHLS